VGIIKYVGIIILSRMDAVRVDSKGRIIIPKYIRKKAKIKEGGYVKIRIEGDTIVIEPIQSIADKYYGIIKIEKWSDDLDEFAAEVMRR
jgi:AbrB family looped-hinge helix DNA binding protein